MIRANLRAVVCSNRCESVNDDLCSQQAADVLSVDDRTHDSGAKSEMDPSSAIQMLMTEAANSSAFMETTSTRSSGICQRQALPL